MKVIMLAVALCTTLVASNLDRRIATGSAASDLILPPPPDPSPGQNMAAWLVELFSDNSTSPATSLNSTANGLGARDAPNIGNSMFGWRAKQRRQTSGNRSGQIAIQNDIFALAWDDGGSKHYNLTIDLSTCQYGVHHDAPVGLYTFLNGTTTNNTIFQDIVKDVYSLKNTPASPGRKNNINPFNSHTFDNAQQLLNEAQDLFDELVCKTDDVPHDALRKLLASSYEYYAAVMLYGVTGGAIGCGVAAVADSMFAPHHVTGHNVFLTGVVTFILGIAGGIIQRQAETGRLAGAQPVAQAIGAGTQAVTQPIVNAAANTLAAGQAAAVENAFIAWFRARVVQMRGQRQAAAAAAANPGGVCAAAADDPANAAELGVGSCVSDSPNDPGSPQESTFSDESAAAIVADATQCVAPENAETAMHMIQDMLAEEANIDALWTQQQQANGTNAYQEFEMTQMNQPHQLNFQTAEGFIADDFANVAEAHCG